MKKIFISIILTVGLLVSIVLPVFATTNYTSYFPISFTDTSGSARTYVPVLTGSTGQNFVNSGYISASGTNSNMMYASTNEPYMLSTTNVPTVIPSLPAGSTVTYDFYTGYSPVQTAFPIIAGTGGYITTPQNAALEFGSSGSVVTNGYVNAVAPTSTYTTGTATFTLGSATVSGSGTTWTVARVGQYIKPNSDNMWYQIVGFTSATSITISSTYPLPTKSSTAYTIGTVGFLVHKEGVLDVYGSSAGNLTLGILGDTATTNSTAVQEAVGSTTYFATTFVAPGSISCTGAEVYGYYAANSTTLTLALRATSGGLPTGSNLASGTVVISNSSAAWNGVTFGSPYTLTGGVTYALVASYASTNYQWYGASSGSGSSAKSTDSGASWSSQGSWYGDYQIITPLSLTTACASSTHTVTASLLSGTLTLQVDSTSSTSSYSSALPSSSSDWLWDVNNIAPYLTYIKETVSSSEVLNYTPTTMLSADTAANSATYPFIVASASNTNASGTAHTITLPSGVGSGELLLAVIATSSNPTITWATGWTQLFLTSQSTNNTLAVAYMVATGNEGTSLSVTTSASVTSSCQSYIIANYQGVPVAGTAATGAASANPTPPSLTSGFGAVDTMWFPVAEDSTIITAYPSTYTGNGVTGTTPYLASAYKNVNAASQSPGTFTAASGNWVANTIAIETANSIILANNDSGGSYSGTITWGSNYDITVSYGAMVSSTSSGVSSVTTIATIQSAPMPAQWYSTGTGISSLPFYTYINGIAQQANIPVQTMYMFVIIALSVGALLLLFGLTKSILIGLLGFDGVLIVGSAQTLVPVWMVFVATITVVGLLYLYNRIQVGG